MTVAGYHVIDCHHHVGSLDALGFNIPKAGGKDPAQVELEKRFAAMDEHGVDQAIVIPGHGYLRPNGVADTRKINDGIAAYRDAHPERFPAAVGIAEPLHGAAGVDEVARMASELGLRGISVHTRFQGVSTDSPLVMALMRKAAEVGIVPFIHAVEGVPDEAIWRAQAVARAIPDTPVIVLDSLGGAEQARHAVIIGKETPNLFFDTSLCHHYLLLEWILDAVGPERLVFGTDYYSMMQHPKHALVLDQLPESSLSSADKQAILAGNLKRILGLPA